MTRPIADVPREREPEGGRGHDRHAAIEGPAVLSPWTPLLSRPVGAAVTLAMLAAGLEFSPGLERLRLVNRPVALALPPVPPPAAPDLATGEARLDLETRGDSATEEPQPAAPAGGPIARTQVVLPPTVNAEKPPVPILDASDQGLAGFYQALAKTARKEPGAITRVVHFGDSVVTSDFVSGTLRQIFQKQFGDAGHGFMLLANPWPAYNHWNVSRFASSGWLVSRIVGPTTPDGIYGLGCVSFRAPPGSRARFGTAKQGDIGRAVSRFEVAYYQQPGGGTFKLSVDNKLAAEVSTDATERGVAYKELTVPDGEHEFEFLTSKGETRAFGVVLERDVPGIVWDAVGIQGARVRFLDLQDDAHWAEQLRWRKANLLVYHFGANESGDGFAYPMEDYHRTLVEVLRQGKRAVPNAGCLVLGAMDRAEKAGGYMRTMSVIPALVKEQKSGAAEAGCAFFDTYNAMGGAGSMASWVAGGLGQADLTHPSGTGSELLAKWIHRALLQGYDAYWKKQADGDASPVPSVPPPLPSALASGAPSAGVTAPAAASAVAPAAGVSAAP